jgi:hypothetical protein
VRTVGPVKPLESEKDLDFVVDLAGEIDPVGGRLFATVRAPEYDWDLVADRVPVKPSGMARGTVGSRSVGPEWDGGANTTAAERKVGEPIQRGGN